MNKTLSYLIKLCSLATIYLLIIFSFEAFAVKPPPGGFFFGIKWGACEDGFLGMKWGASIEDFKKQGLIKVTNGYREIEGILHINSNVHEDLQIGDIQPRICFLFYRDKFMGLSIEPYPMKRKTVKTLFVQYGYPVAREELKDTYGVRSGEDYTWIVDNVRVKLHFATQTSLIYYYDPLFDEWEKDRKRMVRKK